MIDAQQLGISTPFLKWAGGKRWFSERHLGLLPPQFERYIEPFLGSGALFFGIQPRAALLSDLNQDLIASYEVMKTDPDALASKLREYHRNHSSEYYYRVRSEKPSGKVELAAWFLYLNRTCWNGLYRVNLKNEFNVPIGTKTDVVLPSDNFPLTSKLLSKAVLACCDFEETIDAAEHGDFIFVDPPYTVKHNLNGFVKYNYRIFSWSDQQRLRNAIGRAADRGAMILMTNANHSSIKELYEGMGDMRVLSRSSVLAANSAFRAKIDELVVRTWL